MSRAHSCVFAHLTGNMALRFESTGTCLIVKQYLERSRQVLRRELMDKVSTLFQECLPTETKLSTTMNSKSASKISEIRQVQSY